MITLSHRSMLRAESRGCAKIAHRFAWTVDGRWRWSRSLRRWILA